MDVAIMSLLYTSAGSYSSKGQASQAWKAIFAFACCTALLLVAAPGLQMVQASDADPLQDFCVADLSNSAPHVNGFACKPRATVTSKDFVFTGFRKAGSILSHWTFVKWVYKKNYMLIISSSKISSTCFCYVIGRTCQLPCNIILLSRSTPNEKQRRCYSLLYH